MHHHQQRFAPWFPSLSRQETWMPLPNISGAHACFSHVGKRRSNLRAPRGTGGAQRSPPACACARRAPGQGRAGEILPVQGAGGLAAKPWSNPLPRVPTARLHRAEPRGSAGRGKSIPAPGSESQILLGTRGLPAGGTAPWPLPIPPSHVPAPRGPVHVPLLTSIPCLAQKDLGEAGEGPRRGKPNPRVPLPWPLSAQDPNHQPGCAAP